MTTIFVAGSMNIKKLDQKVKERLSKIVESSLKVVVGDADGVDSSIQQYLLEHGAVNTVVYCSGTAPRNNLGGWPVKNIDTKKTQGSRAFFTAKDIEMAEAADYGLMIWDAKSTGTLSNVIELLCRKKKSVVFVNKAKEFKTISNYTHLEDLIASMSEHAREKADEKIGLFGKIDALKMSDAQGQMFA